MLKKTRNELIDGIALIVGDLIATTRKEFIKYPKFLAFFSAVESSTPSSLLSEVFGPELEDPSAEGLKKRIMRVQSRSMHSPFGIHVVLQALIGAAIHQWVFQARFTSLFPHLTKLGYGWPELIQCVNVALEHRLKGTQRYPKCAHIG